MHHKQFVIAVSHSWREFRAILQLTRALQAAVFTVAHHFEY